MLGEKSILVNLHISAWSGRKFDGKATDIIAKSYESAADCGRFNKLLVPREAILAVQRLGSSVRNFHLDNTLPWNDAGTRLLPTTNYFKYIEGLNEEKTKFDNGVIDFINKYPQYIEIRKVDLNRMFEPTDYPKASELPEKFNCSIRFYPVPSVDFRVSLNEHEVEKIRSSVKANLQELEDAANKDLWGRLKRVVSKIVERMEDTDKTFKKTIFENIEELAELVKRLNFSENEDLDKTVERMRTELTEFDADEIRKNPAVRKMVNTRAGDILSVIEQFI